jgi:hypothetical protein
MVNMSDFSSSGSDVEDSGLLWCNAVLMANTLKAWIAVKYHFKYQSTSRWVGITVCKDSHK